MDSEIHLQLEAEPNQDEIDFVIQGLFRYNLQFAPGDEYNRLFITLRDGSGQLVGGLVGGTYWGWLHIDILWMEEDARGRGWGSALLEAAEQEALRRGCHAVNLDTMSFQALPFYERHGYSVFGILEDHPIGHTRIFLQKKLASAVSDA